MPASLVGCRWATIVGCLICGSIIPDAHAQLIPVPERRDHVVDLTRQILYATTNAGRVERFDLTSLTSLSAWEIGGDLGGIDLTPDGSILLIADNTIDANAENGRIHRIDSMTGDATTLEFELDPNQQPLFGERGSWDVVAMSNGQAFFSTDLLGSASTFLREWDLLSNQVSVRPLPPSMSGNTRVGERTWLFRDANYTTMFGLESGSTAGRIFNYDAATDTFAHRENMVSVSHDDGYGGIARNSDLFAAELDTSFVRVFAADLATQITTLASIDGGFAFDANEDLFYGIDAQTDVVRVFETTTWQEIRTIIPGFDFQPTHRFDGGIISLDSDNQVLYVSVDGGIAAVSIVPEPSSIFLLMVTGAFAANRKLYSPCAGITRLKQRRK